jgi:opacity protein-like surface antigen
MRSTSALVGLTLGAVLLVPTTSRALEAPVRIGVLGGLTSANVTTDDPTLDPQRVQGAAGGLSLELRLSDSVGLEARGLFMQKGTKLAADGIPDGVHADIHYIAVPVLLKFHGNGGTRPYLGIGGEVAFRNSAKLKATIAGVKQEVDAADTLESTDFAIHGVVGLEFSLGVLSLFIEGGYSHGLKNIDIEGGESKTRTAFALAGLRIP